MSMEKPRSLAAWSTSPSRSFSSVAATMVRSAGLPEPEPAPEPEEPEVSPPSEMHDASMSDIKAAMAA